MRGRLFFLLPAVLFLSVSCLDEMETTKSPQAAITSFTLGYYNVMVHDLDIHRKDTVVHRREGSYMFPFTIDQINNRIYNEDSLSYGSVINAVTTSVYGVGTIVYSYVDSPDSAYLWSSADSIDFVRGVLFRVASTDGSFLRTYTVDVNVRKVFPDSLVWSRPDTTGVPVMSGISAASRGDSVYFFGTDTLGTATVSFRNSKSGAWNGANAMTGLPAGWSNPVALFKGVFYTVCEGTLYGSEDGIAWNTVRTGIKGVFSQGTESDCFWAVSQDSNIIRTSDMSEWKTVQALPAGFPDSTGVVFSYPLTTNKSITRSVLIGPSDDTLHMSVWTILSNDSVWSRVNTPADESISLPASGNIQAIRYDGALFALEEGAGSFRQSNDNGITWYYCDRYAYDYSSWNRYMQYPDGFKGYGSEFACVTDGKGSIWIMTDDGRVWRGAINRLIKR